MSAPQGPTGLTGANGLQGFRGPRGEPFGIPGPSYTSSSKFLKIESPSGSTITLTEASFYTFYNIAAQSTTTIVFPTRSESYPLPEQAGVFWVFRNNTGSSITLNFSNGTVDFEGVEARTTLTIPIGSGITIAYSSNITGYVAM
jgi:hypothetical protein